MPLDVTTRVVEWNDVDALARELADDDVDRHTEAFAEAAAELAA